MRLSDTDLVLLSAAAQRPEGLLLPSSKHDCSHREKIAARLIKLGLVDEVEVRKDSECWFDDNEDRRGLKINGSGLATLGLEDGADTALDATDSTRTDYLPHPPKPARKASKISIVIEFIERPDGATIEELQSQTDWLPHTIRAALAGLRKKGHVVELATLADGRRAYRLGSGSADAALAPQGDIAGEVH